MKAAGYLRYFFLFFIVLDSWFIASVNAQCVQGDVSVQYSISGSKKPSQRTNDVTMKSKPGCSGNSSVTTGVQGHIGPDSAEQHRRVRQIQRSNRGNPTGINSSTVQIRSNVQSDINNPVDRFPYK
ncbi:MAG: hypothetical protein AAGF26_12345 [Cyanobacteria bacterium P01_G01_bin.49]